MYNEINVTPSRIIHEFRLCIVVYNEFSWRIFNRLPFDRQTVADNWTQSSFFFLKAFDTDGMLIRTFCIDWTFYLLKRAVNRIHWKSVDFVAHEQEISVIKITELKTQTAFGLVCILSAALLKFICCSHIDYGPQTIQKNLRYSQLFLDIFMAFCIANTKNSYDSISMCCENTLKINGNQECGNSQSDRSIAAVSNNINLHIDRLKMSLIMFAILFCCAVEHFSVDDFRFCECYNVHLFLICRHFSSSPLT